MGGPEKINYSIVVMQFGGTEMLLGVRKWPNPVILKNGDGIFPLRAAQRRVKEIKIPCES